MEQVTHEMKMLECQGFANCPAAMGKITAPGQFFVAPPDVKFEVEAAADVAYLCHYKR